MYCKKCDGRVFVDRMFSQKLRIELFCFMCGRRWIIKKDGSAFGIWLENIENNLNKGSYIST